MRKAHYWRPAGAASAPSEILVVDTETHFGPMATVPGGELQTLRLGVALAYRLEKGRRTREQLLHFTDKAPFWELLNSRLDKKRPLWVVAHNLAYDWGVLGGWKVLTSKSFTVKRAAVSSSIFWVKGHLDKKPITLIDTFNYYRCSLSTIGESLGFAKLPMPTPEQDDATWFQYCQRDVEVTALALDNLISFTRSERLGPWQPTIAGLAFSAYRARFMRHQVGVHTIAPSLSMERRAYYGGIVDTNYVGEVPARPVHELDVCSMYPAVCQNPLPIKLKGCNANIGTKTLSRIMTNFLAVADVDIRTKGHTYPVRLPSGTFYPHGEYRTSLAHPELEQALRSGEVTYIHRASWFESAPIFATYMQWAIDKKTHFRREGNKAWATLAKYFGTNLYGKTGQLSPSWKQWGKKSLAALAVRYQLPPDAFDRYVDKPPTLYELEETLELSGCPEAVHVRDYFGYVELKVGEFESRESCPAIAATVTSYARQLMRQFQATAGEHNWFYTDTDSIWCNDDGRKRLEDAGHVGDEVLGLLKLERTHRAMVIHGPKDYETDLVRRIKGVRATAEPSADGGWTQLQFPSPRVQIRDNTPDGVFVRKVTKHLARRITKCKVKSNGWTRPLVFPSERPAK